MLQIKKPSIVYTKITVQKKLGQDITKQGSKRTPRCHSDLFWEFRGSRSLGLKTTSYGVFLFVDGCLIADLSWKNLKRPKRSNLKWP